MNVARSIPRPSIRIVAPVAIAVVVIATVALTMPAPHGDRSSEDPRSIAPSPMVGAGTERATAKRAPTSIVGSNSGVNAPESMAEDHATSIAGRSTTATPASTGIAPSTGTLPAPSIDQRIARTASIQLLVKRRSFEDAWGDAQAVARSAGGFVVSSSRSGSGSSARTASISLRVPSAKFDAAVAQVRRVAGAKVERLDVASEDVSQEYVDTTSRLRHDRAVEARLLTLLAATKTVSEVLAVQARLDDVQAAIEVSTGRIRYLDSVTSMSTIDVTLRVPPAAVQSARADENQLTRALHDAGGRFMARVSSGVLWVGGALPVLLLVGAMLLTARYSVRRYRAR